MLAGIALRQCREEIFIRELNNVFEFKIECFNCEICKSPVVLKEGIVKAGHQFCVERIRVMQVDQACRQITKNAESALNRARS